MTSFDTMDMQQFWKLIEDARRQVPDPADGEEVAARAAALLSAYPREEIVAAEQVLRELMAGSYRTPLWAAAYVINGGCSDDGFDYLRGWLILQGREVFEHVVADPDALADLPVICVDPAWDFDFDDPTEMKRRLPRLAALFLDRGGLRFSWESNPHQQLGNLCNPGLLYGLTCGAGCP
jgi:hypothetical protein